MESTQRIKLLGKRFGCVPAASHRARGGTARRNTSFPDGRSRPHYDYACGVTKLSLAETLAAHDPDRHGGEFMITGRVSAQVM